MPEVELNFSNTKAVLTNRPTGRCILFGKLNRPVREGSIEGLQELMEINERPLDAPERTCTL